MREAIERFIRYIRRRYPGRSTAKHYHSDLRLFDRFVRKPPRAVTRGDVSDFVEDQLERGLSAATVNRRLAALHHFFEYLADEAEDEEWANPVAWLRHKVKQGKPLPRDASEMEIGQLFARINHPRDLAIFQLMLDLGLRVGEIAALQLDDLSILPESPPLGRLRVRGKGDKERLLWLLPETLAVVEAWLQQRPVVESSALFVTRRGRGFSVRGIQERLAHYGRLAGVQVSPHQLRHTFGRRLAEADIALTSLQKLLGHAQVATTQVYIAGAGVDVRADYQAAMASLMAERPGPSPAPAAAPTTAWTSPEAEPRPRPLATAVPPAPEEPDFDLSHYWERLPDWLSEVLAAYVAYRQRRWKATRRRAHTRALGHSLYRIWDGLLRERDLPGLSALRRRDITAYMEARLESGIAANTVNRELTDLWGFLRYAEEQGYTIAASVFRVKPLKLPQRVPRFLSEAEYARLEQALLESTAASRRNDHLDQAWFYLLAHAGLRLGETCDLRLGDVDLVGQRLIVRQGKGNRDRSIPLSTTLAAVLEAYLAVRGPADSDHLLIFRQEAVRACLIQERLRRYGKAVGVQVSPHRMRHTVATRLLNQGMPITSIQRFLGHEKLETTMVYACVHDQTVRADFEDAMGRLSRVMARGEESLPVEVGYPLIQGEINCV